MRVLFLGGTRFTGPSAIRELVGHGHDVTVFHRGESDAALPSGVRHVHGDVGSFAEHTSDLRALEPEVVVDMLAFLPEHAQRLAAFDGVARRGVVVSSADVYLAYGRLRGSEPGALEPVPLTEDAPLRTVAVDEGYDKVGVERAVTSGVSFPVSVLRYPAVFGPGDPQHRLYDYVRRMDDGRPAILLDERHVRWRWARGYSEDVGHALALVVIAEQAAGGVFHVAYPEAASGEEWLRAIAAAVGWSGSVVAAPPDVLAEPLRPPGNFEQDFTLDSTRIRSQLGYSEVVDAATALARTIEWERRNPPDDVELEYAAEDAALAVLDRVQ